MPPKNKYGRGTGTPDPIDIHVGFRLLTLRRRAGLSQQKLADKVGLTFQQIQKYEQGTNRISASKLWYFACALGIEPQDFYKKLNTKKLSAIESAPPAPSVWNAYYSKLSEPYRQLAVSTIKHLIELSKKAP